MRSPLPRPDGLPHASVATVELEEALGRPGCPVCLLVRRAEERWVWTLLHEHSGDVEIHQALAESGGLCADHAQLVERVVAGRQLASADAAARLYLTVVGAARKKLTERRRAVPVPRCPLCRRSEQTARHVAGMLAAALKESSWREAYEASEGLCLRHLEGCLSVLRGEVRTWLRQDAVRRLDQLFERLSELCRKHRYDVQEKITDGESGSWKEALWRIGGLSPF